MQKISIGQRARFKILALEMEGVGRGMTFYEIQISEAITVWRTRAEIVTTPTNQQF